MKNAINHIPIHLIHNLMHLEILHFLNNGENDLSYPLVFMHNRFISSTLLEI
jgi:hypothetical protein